MTSKKAIREKDSAKEIEKPWPEQLDKKEFLEGSIYYVKCYKEVRKEKDQEVSTGWDKGETVSISRWSRKLGCEKKSGWRGGYRVKREDVSRWEISVHVDA